MSDEDFRESLLEASTLLHETLQIDPRASAQDVLTLWEDAANKPVHLRHLKRTLEQQRNRPHARAAG